MGGGVRGKGRRARRGSGSETGALVRSRSSFSSRSVSVSLEVTSQEEVAPRHGSYIFVARPLRRRRLPLPLRRPPLC